jgi:hypothetical protein
MNSEPKKKDRSGVVSIFDIIFGGDAKNYQKVKEKTLENREKEKEDGKD